jgi:hypothetical protein
MPAPRRDDVPVDAACSTRLRWAIAGAVVLVAFLARLLPVLRGAGLQGVLGYDDGVYVTGAASLVAGRRPYADFTLLHPPGILLVRAPFAALGRITSDHVGLAVARLAFMALGAVNAGLVSLLAGRFSPSRAAVAASATGGLFYALWFSSIYTTRTTLLEGPGTLSLLVALLLVWRRPRGPAGIAFVGAGAALGFGACTKIWGVVPLAVVAAWVFIAHGRSAATRLVAGAVALVAAVCGPFLVAAPTQMPRMVLLDQLHRPLSTPSPVQRALDASSLHWNLPQLVGTRAVVVLALLALAVLVCCVIAWHIGGALPVLLLAATTVILAASPSYFTHYGELVAGPLALVLAGAVAAWAARTHPRRFVRPSTAVPVLVVLLLEAPTQARAFGGPLDVMTLRRAVAPARCVATDTPSMLAATDSLTRGLDAGCDVPVDLTGVLYDVDRRVRPDGRTMPRRLNKPWQARLRSYLMAADAQLLVFPARDLLNRAGVRELLAANRVVAEDGTIRVYRRR